MKTNFATRFVNKCPNKKKEIFYLACISFRWMMLTGNQFSSISTRRLTVADKTTSCRKISQMNCKITFENSIINIFSFLIYEFLINNSIKKPFITINFEFHTEQYIVLCVLSSRQAFFSVWVSYQFIICLIQWKRI